MNTEPLIIEKYGITLSQLQEADIQLVRQWRNDPEVGRFLLTQTNITEEQQEKWFKSLDTEHNKYFIIKYKEKKIGLCQLRFIDFKEETAEPGIFIYEEKYRNSILGFQAIFSLLDYAFYDLELEMVYADFLDSNQRAIKFNEAFGFEMADNGEEGEDKGYKRYTLTKGNYRKKSKNLKESIIKRLRPSARSV
jgi:UDP-4-amino-4,6-dideoxy-N-acetyl-beta-L-altrosamine N-acetyltransferase